MTTRIDRDGPLGAALRRGDPTAAEDLVAAYGEPGPKPRLCDLRATSSIPRTVCQSTYPR